MSRGLDALQRLRAELARLNVAIEETEGGVLVQGSPGGFEVAMYDDGEEATVYAGGQCHCHLESPEEAVRLFLTLLGPDARLAETFVFGSLAGASIEVLEGGRWRPHSTYGNLLALCPFGRSKRVRPNAVLPAR